MNVNPHNPPAKGHGPTTPSTVRVVLAKDGSLLLPRDTNTNVFATSAGATTNNTLRIVVADS